MAIGPRAAVLAAAVVLAVAVLRSWTALLVLDAALVLLVLADLARAARLSDVTVRRGGASSTRLGNPAQVHVDVVNAGSRALRGRVRDAWPPSANQQPTAHAVGVPPGQRRAVVTTLRPSRRGTRRADRVTLRAFGPLGLAARQVSRTVPGHVDVLPPFHSRRHLASRLARLRELDGRTAVLQRGQGSEFDALREYVVGDDVRSIDWRASARAADVMVRTWRPERDRHVLLVVDCGRTAAGRVGDEPRLDSAIEAALLLGALADRAGDRVELLAWDRDVRGSVRGVSGAALLSALPRALAPIEASLVETDWAGAVTSVHRRATSRSLVVLLTALEPDALEEGLLPVMSSLTRRHLVLVAGVIDPAEAAFTRGRGDASNVYRAASAERTHLRRRALAKELNRRGVEVVDALPSELPPAVADRYLALKAAGRL